MQFPAGPLTRVTIRASFIHNVRVDVVAAVKTNSNIHSVPTILGYSKTTQEQVPVVSDNHINMAC